MCCAPLPKNPELCGTPSDLPAQAVQLSSDLDLGLDPVDGDAAARALPAGRVAQAAGAKRAHEERDQRFLDEMQRAADRLELDERKKPPPES